MGRATFVALLFFVNIDLSASIFNVRALWIVRDHITSKESIDDILIFADFTAAEIGKNDVFWRLSSQTAQ